MAGLLEAFVIKTADPQRVATLVPRGQTVYLSGDFHLIPLTQTVKAALNDHVEPQLGFVALTRSMVAVAEELSHLGPVAYCHLEFHGGTRVSGGGGVGRWSDPVRASPPSGASL